ncbi:putative transcriptional regulator [Streptomyces microflavus DSM 40593]|uniref:Putative transcriptional regulator n=1 Tax=Streptomyces microflavus DSM 40593 TaxID=1303692 RepID=N0CYJ7_STRMI|nr:putative transcriptional regulator [Streptomyces microflavus DSM 40593]
MYHEPMPPDRVRARRLQIADQLRAVRLHAEMTQESVSLRAGISLDTYNRIEQGHASPRLDTLIKIADAIGVPLEDLVRQTDQP